MLVKVFNLRMDLDSMQYDDSLLVQFASEHDVVSMKTHFFYFREEPIWSVIVTYRSQHRPSTLQQSVRHIKPYRNVSKKEVDPGAVTPFNQQAYEALRVWRNGTARQLGHPPSNLFTNRQLEEIVNLEPSSINQLTKISGIGKYKSSTYGHEILGLLQQHPFNMVQTEVISPTGTDQSSNEDTRENRKSNDGKDCSRDQKTSLTDGGDE